MGIKGWFLGGRDELGWADLHRPLIGAIAALAHYANRGSTAFPPEVEVEIRVEAGSADVVRSFLHSPEFDRQVEAGLANRCAMAPKIVRSPSGLPQNQLSTMNEWFRARIAASIVDTCVTFEGLFWQLPGPEVWLKSTGW